MMIGSTFHMAYILKIEVNKVIIGYEQNYHSKSPKCPTESSFYDFVFIALYNVCIQTIYMLMFIIKLRLPVQSIFLQYFKLVCFWWLFSSLSFAFLATYLHLIL